MAGAHVSLRWSSNKRVVTTDDDGVFLFDNLEPRRYVLVASTSDLYARPTLVRVSDTNEPLVLRMHAAATIVLRVVADRAPVQGARVVLQQLIPVDSYYAELPLEPRETDAQGVVTVRGLAPDNYRGWVVPTDPGWAQEPLAISCGDRGGSVEQVVTLERGAQVEGVVRGPFNRPVSGATIRLWHSERQESLYQTKSDEDGRWRAVLPAGHYRVVPSSHRYQTIRPVEIETDGRTPQTRIELSLGLPSIQQTLTSWLHVDRLIDAGARRRIAGVVVDAKGKPVEEVHVYASPTSDGGALRGLNATTDSNGWFEFEARDNDEYEIKAGWKDPRDGGHVVMQRVRPAT